MIHPAFEGVMGHERQLEILSHATERPATAYLFCGLQNVGKQLIAERFARLLLEEERTANLAAHPDFMRLTRDEGAREITVKSTRELITRLQLTSARGGRKIALIEQAERLNEEAANALLKIVEEPPQGCVFLFITERPDRLPATLRSRLTSFAFGRVATGKIVNWLREQGVSKEDAHTWALECGGAPGTAMRIMEYPEAWLLCRASVHDLIATLTSATLGKQCAAFEKLSQSLEANDDAEAAWRGFLTLLMQECGTSFATAPSEAVRVGHGLIHAWNLVGSQFSPRLALEWAAVKPYLKSNLNFPSFLHPSYL